MNDTNFSIADRRVKTAFLSDKVKGGKTIWVSNNLIN